MQKSVCILILLSAMLVSLCGCSDSVSNAVYSEQVYEGCGMNHDFKDNICIRCDWRIPGVYMDNKLTITWDDLVYAGHVSVRDGKLENVNRELTGLLVVDESIESVTGFSKSSLQKVYLPSKLKTVNVGAFSQSKIESVRFFGNCVEEIADYAFKECENLKEFEWPESVTAISNAVFWGCTSLERIEIPNGVTWLSANVFTECVNLKEILLPDTLEWIGPGCFKGTGIESIRLPSNVHLNPDYFGSDSYFENCTNLRSIDFSECKYPAQYDYTLRDVFRNCISLESINISPDVKRIENALCNCTALTELELHEGIVEFKQNQVEGLPAVERIVWPKSLVAGKDLIRNAVNVKRIDYMGSEALWNMVEGKELLSNDVVVNFSYAVE